MSTSALVCSMIHHMALGWLMVHTSLLLMVALQPALGQTHFKWSPSKVTKQAGHYPYTLCTLTNVVLNASDGVFYYNSKTALHSDVTGNIWQLQNRPLQSQTEIQCDEEYDIGHVFLIFYFSGGSNYYHLHYDTMVPLFKDAFWAQNDSQGPSRVFMPAVETSRMQRIDWKTVAFENADRYWVQTTKFIAGKYPFRPLDDTLRRKGHNICLKEARFGTAQVTYTDKTFMRSFVKHVMANLQIVEPGYVHPRVGVIHRSRRRRILNDKELVDMLSKEVDAELLEFAGMSFREQVQMMQRFTVLAGINGAGLMNCLYLPANAVCIQMGAYKSDMNYVQFGDVLKTRGPYREWHNTHEDLHRPVPGDVHNIRPDTIVHLDEFRTIIQEALKVASANSKDEL